MSPKGILITFAIISLVLIGIMFLAVDGRNNVVLDDFTTLNDKFEKTNQEAETNIDTLTKKVKSLQSKRKIAALEAFDIIAEDLLNHIESLEEVLFSNKTAEATDFDDPKIKENNALFFKENAEYTDSATQFIAKLDAFENNIRTLQQTFPKIKTVKATVRNEYTKGLPWLDYNFKDFPAIASYAKLKALKSDINSKQEEIISILLSK